MTRDQIAHLQEQEQQRAHDLQRRAIEKSFADKNKSRMNMSEEVCWLVIEMLPMPQGAMSSGMAHFALMCDKTDYACLPACLISMHAESLASK